MKMALKRSFPDLSASDMRLAYLVAVMAWVAYGGDGLAGDPFARPLSLQDCITLTLAHNLQLKKERYSEDIERYTFLASRGIYDPIFSSGATDSVLHQPPQFDPKKPGSDAAYDLTRKSVSSGISGYLPSGLNYSINGSLSSLSANTLFPTNTPSFSNFPPYGIRVTNAYLATAGIVLSQPLLKDSWIDQGRETLQINKKNLKISQLAFRNQVMSTVTAVSVAYFNLTAAAEQVAMQGKSVDLARHLLGDVDRKTTAGGLSAVDQRIAEAGLAKAETALLGAEQNLAVRRIQLRSFLGDSRQEWPDSEISASDPLLAIRMDTDLQEATTRSLQSRPEILEMKLALEKQDIILRFASNQRLPSLNLVGSYGWQAWDPTVSGSLDQIRGRAYPVYSIGLVLSYPLGNVSARNKYKANLAAKSQELIRFQQVQQDVIAEVETAIKSAEIAFKQVQSTRRGREASEAALALEEKLYQSGLVTTFYVVEFQRNFAAERLSEITALADYNVALVRLDLATGATLERNRIDLKIR